MSILIKGIEMPHHGMVINIYADGRVTNHFDEFGYQIGTAIPVPPHGRLVEDIAVIEQIDEWLNSVGTVMVGHGLSYYGELLGCIEDAPTIIPAEEGE